MTLKILKQFVKRGGLKGIILTLLVQLAVSYIRKKIAGSPLDPQTLQDKLCNASRDWNEILNGMDSSDKNRFLNEVLKRL